LPTSFNSLSFRFVRWKIRRVKAWNKKSCKLCFEKDLLYPEIKN
jgi:hypothetical protein